MNPSVLLSTKKILGLSEDYTAFDPDILQHINAAFFTLGQLGVGLPDGVVIEDAEFLWTDLDYPMDLLAAIRTYVALKVRFIFDPPPTSFAIEAMKNQIEEHEWRINVWREDFINLPVEEDDELILDGGVL